MNDEIKDPDWLVNGPQPRKLTRDEDDDLLEVIDLLDDAQELLYRALYKLSVYGFVKDELDSALQQLEEFNERVDEYREDGWTW